MVTYFERSLFLELLDMHEGIDDAVQDILTHVSIAAIPERQK
jgi:hypothetical protein